MVVRIVLVAAVIAAALVFVQQRQVLQNAGLTGYCEAIATPKDESGYWHVCRPGKLTGTPELSRNGSCTRAGGAGEVERWRCETPLEQAAAGQ
jgi:hypothetical protein